MSPTAIAVLAVSMSIDAFVVSVGRGAALGRPRLSEALRTGAIFGLVEATTPVVGWAIGVVASAYVAAIDHWIAFALLAGVGLHMIWASLRRGADDAPVGSSLAVLLATALGTSIDAMAVGVSLAFLDVGILTLAIAIGLSTFLLASGGMMLGRLIGVRFGRLAERAAGVTLIGLGCLILMEHLGSAGGLPG